MSTRAGKLIEKAVQAEDWVDARSLITTELRHEPEGPLALKPPRVDLLRAAGVWLKPLYLIRTQKPRFHRFVRFERREKSITYLESTPSKGTIPSLATTF